MITSIEEAIEVARRADIPVQISHLKITAPINNTPASQLLDLIESARQEGLNLHADQYPYAEGIRYLLVNGKLSIDKGKATGKRGGRAVKRA